MRRSTSESAGPACGEGLAPGEPGTLGRRPQGGGLEDGADGRDLQRRERAAVAAGVGEDRGQVGDGDAAPVLHHLRALADLHRHRSVELDLELVGAGPAPERRHRQRVHGVDRGVHHAAQVVRQLAGGHRVGGEHVLAVGSLEQQVRRHEVHAGVAAGGVLHDQQRGDRLLPVRRP